MIVKMNIVLRVGVATKIQPDRNDRPDHPPPSIVNARWDKKISVFHMLEREPSVRQPRVSHPNLFTRKFTHPTQADLLGNVALFTTWLWLTDSVALGFGSLCNFPVTRCPCHLTHSMVGERGLCGHVINGCMNVGTFLAQLTIIPLHPFLKIPGMQERSPDRMGLFWYFGLTRAIMASVRPVSTGNKVQHNQPGRCVWDTFFNRGHVSSLTR